MRIDESIPRLCRCGRHTKEMTTETDRVSEIERETRRDPNSDQGARSRSRSRSLIRIHINRVSEIERERWRDPNPDQGEERDRDRD